jgi:hypothetical protein
MTSEDIPAALFWLAMFAVGTVLFYVAAAAVVDVIRNRPAITRDPITGSVQIVRSPNPNGLPRRHGRAS